MKFSKILILLLFFASCKKPLIEHKVDADVLIYGGNASAIVAAIAAKREGSSVIVLAPGSHLGGMVTGGISATDFGIKDTIGGIALEFFQAVGKHYGKKFEFFFEPKVASLVFRKMLADEGIKILTDQRISGRRKKDGVIHSVETLNGESFSAKIYIDASYEGDLLAEAGVAYVVGRESKSEYGEELAGVYPGSAYHQWPENTFGTTADGESLVGVNPGPMAELGSGDKKIQAYNFRPCLTKKEGNKTPFKKPEGYDESQYELLVRLFEKKPGIRAGDVFRFNKLPAGKYDINNKGPFSTDYINQSWEYPEASFSKREEIIEKHEIYTKGLFYFISHSPKVPDVLRNGIKRWGYCKDEWINNDNFPPMLTVREARRMKGAYFLTQNDIAENSSKKDSVGLASSGVDSHYVERLLKSDGSLINEGYKRTKEKPFAIPYRSLTPIDSEVKNLLVSVAISASHVSYAAIRMEPVYMMLGHSAGVAASIAARENVPVQKVSLNALQGKLREQGQKLEP